MQPQLPRQCNQPVRGNGIGTYLQYFMTDSRPAGRLSGACSGQGNGMTRLASITAS